MQANLKTFNVKFVGNGWSLPMGQFVAPLRETAVTKAVRQWGDLVQGGGKIVTQDEGGTKVVTDLPAL